MEVYPAEVGASPDLIISDLIQDTSDLAVSSLASQLGLENATPLLNLDFMSFLQPSTPGSSDSVSTFSLPPDMSSLNIDPPAVSHLSSPLDILSPHLSSPLIPHPLNSSTVWTSEQGACTSSILITQSDSLSACHPSISNTKPSPPGVTTPTASASSGQGDLVNPSPVEYLDLMDIGSLMGSADGSKLLEGIPEDMAKSIQTIVQLDEQTWN